MRKRNHSKRGRAGEYLCCVRSEHHEPHQTPAMRGRGGRTAPATDDDGARRTNQKHQPPTEARMARVSDCRKNCKGFMIWSNSAEN
ncbi:hypothetical protein U1Q18_016012 [Sarracenia purpurea var. burkii]